MIQSVDHVAIAVRSIEERRDYYEQVLGAHFEGIEEFPDQKVRVAFYQVGAVQLELLEATSPDSLVASFLQHRGEGLHHIAFGVEDLRQRIVELRQQGVRLVDEQPRPGAHGTEMVFLHPAATGGVLTELCAPRRR